MSFAMLKGDIKGTMGTFEVSIEVSDKGDKKGTLDKKHRKGLTKGSQTPQSQETAKGRQRGKRGSNARQCEICLQSRKG